MAKNKPKSSSRIIASNKKARHDYQIESTLEAGLMLAGWELKSIRSGKVQLRDSYVVIRNDEAWLVGCQISPLLSASTHIVPHGTRDRKLLMHAKEIERLSNIANQTGYTIIALDLHWTKQYVKCELGVGKGKKLHDKRETMKERDWNRQKERVMKHSV